jgi:hypothetical protein
MRNIHRILPPILVLLLALPFIAAAENGAEDEVTPEQRDVYQPASEVGRYRLFDGQLVVGSLKGPEVAERQLMKIDTVTGQVWIGKQVQYVDRRGKVVQQRYWEPFEQYLEAPPTPAPQGR